MVKTNRIAFFDASALRGELVCGDELKLVRTEDDIRLMKGEIKLVRPVRLAGACRIDL